MKKIYYILLIVLLSCGGDEVYVDYLYPRQAISEYQVFSSEEEISTIPGAVIISSLESPKILNDTTILDINEIGKDRFFVKFNATNKFSYRLEPNQFIKFRLINRENNSVLFELNPQNLNIDDFNINAGNYIYEIEIIESEINENFTQTPIFIQPDLIKIRQKGLDENSKFSDYKNIDLYTYISFSGCSECNLTNVVMSYMKLNNFNNTPTNLSKSNLKSAIGFKANLSNFIFDEANLNTVKFDSCIISNSTFNNIKDANYSNFEYSVLKNSKILNTSATYVKFNYCNFQQSDLQNSIFSNSEFRAAEFPNVNASNSDFTDCIFRGASLFHTDFTNSSLYNADISYSDARGSIFCNSIKTFLKKNSVLTDSLTQCLNE